MRTLVLLLSLCCGAAPAFASGVDLTVGACPGSEIASNTSTLDCTGGQAIVLLATFMPAESLPDRAGIALGVDLHFPYPHCYPPGPGPCTCANDMTTDATFWNLDLNTTAFNSSHLRPRVGCSSYLDTWTYAGAASSGSGVLGQYRNPCTSRIYALCYRAEPIAVTANQRLFAMQLIVDASAAVEAGGTLVGCTAPVQVDLVQIAPRTFSGADGTLLTGPSVYGTSVMINGQAPTVAARRTWGNLKSLYR